MQGWCGVWLGVEVMGGWSQSCSEEAGGCRFLQRGGWRRFAKEQGEEGRSVWQCVSVTYSVQGCEWVWR